MSGPYSQDLIESVRAAGDIVRVIADYVPLKQAGARLKGLCPFHQEKTPSFSVDPKAQLFYCFGCQTGGDIFKFVQLYEKADFGEAVERLAKQFGVPLPTARHGAEDPRERLTRLNLAAEQFYRSLLDDPEAGRRARDYLTRRGLGPETIQTLRLGYAPDGWEGLRDHLLAKHYKPEELLAAGLILPRKSGSGHYDRFRDRLIFPIRSIAGRTVAFGGRALGDAEPKYINSPETPVYTKGEQLYGLDLAKVAIRQEGFAIVVEGYLDLAAVLQAGLANVVASLGTAFTPAQARLLARYTRKVAVSYDGDAAGAQATIRSLDLLLENGFEVRVVELPAGKDPDDCIRDEGREAYIDRVRTAPEYLQFLIGREVTQRDLNQDGEAVAAVNALLPHVAKLKSAIERASWATRLADSLQIDDELVLQELRSATRSAGREIRQRPPAPARPLTEVESCLVSVLLGSSAERQRWAVELDPAEIEGSRVAGLVATILRLEREGRPVEPATVLAALQDEAERDLLTRIAFRDAPEDGPGVEDCLWTFQRERLRREERRAVRELGQLQRATSTAGGDDDMDRRLAEIQQLAKKRDALHGPLENSEIP